MLNIVNLLWGEGVNLRGFSSDYTAAFFLDTVKKNIVDKGSVERSGIVAMGSK